MILFSGARQKIMTTALHGFNVTGIPLIEFSTNGFLPIWGIDDEGIYYWASLVGSFFNISAHEAASYFLLSLICIGGAIALLGFYCLVDKWWLKVFSTLCVLYIMRRVFYSGDVYIVYFVAACFIPLCIALFKKSYFRRTAFYFFIIGLMGAELGFIRSFAAFHTFLFCCVALFTTQYFKVQQKLLLLLFLVLGYGAGYLHPWYVLQQRDNYLKQHGVEKEISRGHPLWHNFYAGFGFIPNEWGIEYDDGNVACRFIDLEKNIICGNKNYEEEVKKAVFRMIQKYPFFVGQVFFAKLGVLLYYFLVFGGFFFLLSLFFRREKQWDLPWFTALVASGVPMMIAIPLFSYLPGFLAISFFYGLFLLNNLVKQASLKKIYQTVVSKSLRFILQFLTL